MGSLGIMKNSIWNKMFPEARRRKNLLLEKPLEGEIEGKKSWDGMERNRARGEMREEETRKGHHWGWFGSGSRARASMCVWGDLREEGEREKSHAFLSQSPGRSRSPVREGIRGVTRSCLLLNKTCQVARLPN